MRLWIDTEFNDYRGELISMALVDDEGREWYEVLECKTPSPWVAKHVMPRLEKAPIALSAFQKALEEFLRPYPAIHIVADWPDDIHHFCQALITGPGYRIDTPPLTMEIRRDLNDAAQWSETPHNALSDARVLRTFGMSLEAKKTEDQFYRYHSDPKNAWAL